VDFPAPFSPIRANGTGFDLEGYLIQGVDTGKGFIQIFYLKYIIIVIYPIFSICHEVIISTIIFYFSR
jgi:hypothetical protein